MISKAHFNNQTSTEKTIVSKNAVSENKEQQAKNQNAQKVEILAKYRTAIENGYLENQILAQRGYIRGYKGF